MRRLIVLFSLSQLLALSVHAQITVNELLVENRHEPIGLDVTAPRFTWIMNAAKRNVSQSAYEVHVSNDLNALDNTGRLLWNSGKVSSDSSVHVAYKGSALEPGKRYYWKVRVWDQSGKTSAWSKPSFWQTGMLQPGNWQAKWIEPGYIEDPILRPCPLLRKQFTVHKKIASATAYITAHGLYEAFINGRKVGDAYLTPGWTSYNKRLQYQTYDVTDLLKNGTNAVGVCLGNGWYRGVIGFSNNKNTYGKNLGLLFQLDIHYTDGTSETILSDGSWRSSKGAIRSSEIYDGEINDARLSTDWQSAGFNDKDWKGVNVQDYSLNNLVATVNEPVRKHETYPAIKVITTPKGEKVIDFGQNLVGWVVVKVRGKAGDSVKIMHAEVLDKDGNFYTENLRAAKATDTYILNGKDEETFEPHFTFHGFRYIKVEGYPGELNPSNFTAVTLYSDMKPTGTFTSSNPMINQLQHNIQWGQKGNFLDVPTDCPQRDERLGWTGDAQVFSRTASFNMNVDNFFAKWLQDVAADQLDNGSVPFVIPNILGAGAAGSTGWADVSTIVPWNIYLAYGDKKVLEQQYQSMKAWVEYMHKQSKNDLWNTGFHFGDWLFYRPEDDNDGRSAVTDKYLIAQCFYAHSTQLLINAASVLGRTDDVNNYTELLSRIKEAFMKEYVTSTGRLVSGTQTAYVLALNFDMLPETMREQAVQRLVENVHSYNDHLSTGFLGTPYLCHVLTRFGHSDLAYTLLLQQTFPSWLYPVKMGATTIWERWNGIKTDGTFAPASMNSFNHYAYGAIGDWMYRSMAGLDTYSDQPGYKHIKIQPHIGGGFTNVAASLQTYYGTASVTWKTEGAKVIMDVQVPVNTTATVYLPSTDAEKITEGGKALSSLKDIRVNGSEKDYTPVNVGSGSYHFELSR